MKRPIQLFRASRSSFSFPAVLLSAASLLTATACTQRQPATPTFSTRDSAGIVIAENTGDLPEDGGEWSLSPEPVLEIGDLEGEDPYLFQRIWGACRLSDGRIAVMDSPAAELRVFSPIGEHLRTFGRKGEGPGEFNSPVLMGVLPGDTLVVVDRRLRRISQFHPEAGFLQDAAAGPEIPGFLLTDGMFSDGTVLIHRTVSNDDLINGYHRLKLRYRRVGVDGSLAVEFGEFVGDELVQATQSDGKAVITAIGNAPFGKEAVVAVGQQHFFYGSQDSYEIQGWNRDGGLERIIRRRAEFLPVTDDQVADRLAEELEHLNDDGNDLSQQYRRQFEATPIPDFHPAHGEIYADLLGYLWTEETRPSDQEPRMVSVFDPEGRLVAALPLPDGLRVMEIGADYVLGSYSDELGVQYLRMYSLQRPG